MPDSHLLQFIGGFAFFFFGLYSVSQALQSYAGDRFKNIIAKSTHDKFRSLMTGILITFLLQSSYVVTVMTVGLSASGLLALESAMAVLLGAGIGTTFVVLLISVKSITQYGIVLIVIGLILRFLADQKKIRTLGEILFGLGLIFFGLNTMSEATVPLKTSSWLPLFFQFMEGYPFINFLIALGITAVVHSSSVVLGLLISLAYSGAITFEVAFPLILGANVGTSFSALLVGIKAPTDGRRVAWANFILRIGAVLLLIPFLNHFIDWVIAIDRFILVTLMGHEFTVYSAIAVSDLLFNVCVTIFFFPLLGLGKRLVCWLIPERGDVKPFGPLYLDKSALSTPSLAFSNVSREVVRMGEIAKGMFKDSLELFKKYNMDMVEDIESRDQKLDILYKAIRFYIAKLSFQNLEEQEANTSLHLMSAANEIETIGDTVERQIVRLARKKWNKGTQFSEEGWSEICEMHQGILEVIDLAIGSVAIFNQELALKIHSRHSHLSDRMEKLKMSHLMRLHEGLKESFETSSIHLELLSLFHQINLSLLAMVDYLLPEEGE